MCEINESQDFALDELRLEYNVVEVKEENDVEIEEDCQIKIDSVRQLAEEEFNEEVEVVEELLNKKNYSKSQNNCDDKNMVEKNEKYNEDEEMDLSETKKPDDSFGENLLCSSPQPESKLYVTILKENYRFYITYLILHIF